MTMPLTKRILRISVSLAVLCGGYWWWTFQSSSESDEGKTVKTATVKRGDIRASVSGSGQVFAESQVDLQPVSAGEAIDIVSVSVRNNETVQKGDLLVTLDTREPEKEIRDATLALRNEEIQMAKVKNLYRRANERDRRERQLQEIALANAQNRLFDAQEDREDYFIRAPFDGIVTGLSVSAGDSVSRDDVLASIVTEKLLVRIVLNEVDAANVSVGKSALLSFGALNLRDIPAVVSKIDTLGTVSQNVVSYNAELSFENAPEKLKPGMSVDADVLLSEKRAVLTAPNAAIRTDSEGKYVLVSNVGRSNQNSEQALSEKDFRKVRVEVGISDETTTEVIGGLEEGDVIVASSVSSESSGSNVSSPQNSSGGGRNRSGGIFPF